MDNFELKVTDHSNDVLAELEKATYIALNAVGLAAEAHAKEGAPVGTTRSTGILNYHGGTLRKSITHKVVDGQVYVGTNASVTYKGRRIHYPIFVEYGTGIYADGGKGRQSPWVWRDKNGKFHYTRGMKPTHFLRNAVSSPKHINEYKTILKTVLQGDL